MEIGTEKTCSRCKQSKPLGDFGLDNRRGSPKAICKPCDSQVHKLRHAEVKNDESYKSSRRAIGRASYRVRRAKGLCWKCDSSATHGIYCEVHSGERARSRRIERAGIHRICPACNQNALAYREKHCAECSDTKGVRFRAYQSRWRFEQRLKAFDKYGGAICGCCKESNPKFLTIDHIESDGAAHRKEIGRGSLYRWLKRHNYPPGFRVLCFNCNCGREYNGGICPHKEVLQQ